MSGRRRGGGKSDRSGGARSDRRGGPGGRGSAQGSRSGGPGSRAGAQGGRSGASGSRAGGQGGRSSARPESGGQSNSGGPNNTGGQNKSDRSSLGGQQVEGRQAVRELLIAGRRQVSEVFLTSDMEPAPILEDIVDLAASRRVPVREIGRGKFDAMTRTESSQGVMAMAQALPGTSLDELASRGRDGQPPFLVAMDGVTDPGNLGAFIRTAECAGVSGLILPKHRAVHITPTVTKTAAGAIEYLNMTLVGGMPTALAVLKDAGVWVIGLDGDADVSLYDLRVATEPIALVMGSEGSGLSRLVADRCDQVVSIPLGGELNSLNVAAAGAVATFEVGRARQAAPG